VFRYIFIIIKKLKFNHFSTYCFIIFITINMTENTDIKTESYAFQAEINQLMSLIINTFYSNKEIFLRELISNASDALDKIRHQSLTDMSCLGEETELKIRIQIDKDNKLLHIFDTGIGMTKNDLINNLGTIAHSGTKDFMQKLTGDKNGDISMIGQFGVGFYSAFLVADIVDVSTKHNDDCAYRWESSAGGSFTITPIEEMPFSIKRGTCLTLHLKDEQCQYLEEQQIKNIIKKHSQFIGYPIELYVQKTREIDVSDDEPEPPKNDDDDVKVEEVDKNKDAKKTKKITEKYNEYELQNTEKPIWLRDPSEITSDEYRAFYKTVSTDYNPHLAVKHFKVEGQLEFRSILFAPKKAPIDMFENNKKKRNLKLYVRKVFIMDDCEDLCPEWLSFIKGVVDNDDLPLNVSREMLQQNKILSRIKKTIVKKSLELFDEISQNQEDFKQFYDSFGKNIKLGIHEDTDNRAKLCNLLRYPSSNNDWVSLKDYCTRSKNDKIYYLAGSDLAILKSSPFIEKCNKKGYEVIFMTEPIDEYVMQQVKEYTHKTDDKESVFKFINLSKEGFDLEETDEEKQEKEQKAKDHEKLCKKMKDALGDRVEKVVVSTRLCETPCVVVTGEFGWSANMEQIMKNQALRDSSMASYMKSKKTLEINTDHKIIRKLYSMCDDVSKSEKTFKDIVSLMYDSTLLVSGFTPDEPKSFNERINNMIVMGLSIDDDTVEDETTNPNEIVMENSSMPTHQEVKIESQESVMESVD
jgi:molecular chaperone HtpG